MKTLPKWIYFNGKTYYLFEEIMDEPVKSWYSFFYAEDKNSIPPDVVDGNCGYFLCTSDQVREVAYDDLLNRINNMKPWLL